MKLKSSLVVVSVFFLSTGWTIRDLGTLPGGMESAAYGINDRGQIVGAARHADGEWRAVFWDLGGSIFPIPTTADKVCCDSYAFEINEGATVVGIAPSADGRWRRAFLWKPGAPLATELPSAARATAIRSTTSATRSDVGTKWTVDEIIPVKTEAAKEMARRLAREEGLFAGTSSGANVVAAIQIAERMGRGARVVTLMADSGLKYVNTDVYRRG